jgi:hypothetical protein
MKVNFQFVYKIFKALLHLINVKKHFHINNIPIWVSFFASDMEKRLSYRYDVAAAHEDNVNITMYCEEHILINTDI